MSALLAFVLAVSLIPALAHADDASPEEDVAQLFIESSREAKARFEASGNVDDLQDRDAYRGSQGDSGSMALMGDALPSSFDLRDRGVVPSVKLQAPWGTCWSFGAIAASEVSIMSDLGWTVDSNEIDLSELHLAWFAYTPLPADAGPQGGEGVHTVSTEARIILNQGGLPFTATSVFSSGVGPVNEADAPYKNKENLIIKDSNDEPYIYSPEGDWSVGEEKRFAQVLELEESAVLPSPAARAEDGSYVYDTSGTQAIKEELMAGRAVTIGFHADASLPGQTDPPVYIDTDNWAHYTYREDASANHSVAIVGWDDDYPASNFLAGHQPAENGAFIARNSWGWKDGEFPNRDPEGWGVEGNGYFYLSYYDMSIDLPETFDYYTDKFGQEPDYYLIDQYDYMPANGVTSFGLQKLVAMANVFEADEDQNVRSLSCETANPGTEVTYELYLLNEGFADPRDGTLLTSFTETYTYGGYHRVQLDEGFLVRKGQQYSIVVTQKAPNGYQVLADRARNEAGMNYVNAMVPDANLTSYAVGVINKGESFLLEDGEWTDWSEIVAEIKLGEVVEPYGPIFDYDNFAIKAFADPVVIPVTVTVPDLAGLTEAEALAALGQLGLAGQAGVAEYSDTVEAGRVIRQDTQAGTAVDQGTLIIYHLSLGKDPNAGKGKTDQGGTGPGTLAKAGDGVAPSAALAAALTVLAFACVIAAAFILHARRRRLCE